MGGKLAAFNLRRFPRSTTDETVSTQLPTPSETIGFGWPRKGDILKTLLKLWNGEDTAWENLKGMSHNPVHPPGKWRDTDINEGQSWVSHAVSPTSPKPSSPTKRSSSRILRGYCGVVEFMTLAQFTLGPKARAEESIAKDMHESPNCLKTQPRRIPSSASRSTLKEKTSSIQEQSKWKATNTAIKNSASDRSMLFNMLFNFYNYPQLL